MVTQKKKRTTQKQKVSISKTSVPSGKKKGSRKSKKQNAIILRVKDFLSRRPHRSFRLTRRRDYNRSLKLVGYWSFTFAVLGLVKANRKLFLLLGLVYIVISVLLLGIGSQDTFTELQAAITQTGQEVFQGNWGDVGTAALLTVSTITGSISPTLTGVQQVFAVLLGLLVWLTTVWLLRQRMAGHVVRLRDGLYNAGAPIVATSIVFLILVLQLLPIGLAMVGYAAAQSTGLLSGGVEAMLFWAAAGGLAALSLYWITSSAVALVVVTLPGMYPFRALKIAGDMVVGRRLRILYRILWMILMLVLFWVVILIPIILIDIGLKNLWPAIQWLPVIPVVMTILSTISLIWIATYVYVLYRKIVDDDASPA